MREVSRRCADSSRHGDVERPGGASLHDVSSGAGRSARLQHVSRPGRGRGRRSSAREDIPACFFPADATVSTAHAAHVEADATHANGLPCSTCHPVPGNPVIGGAHGNGTIDVKFDAALAGAAATFDPSSKACTNACHARPGGARPKPAWSEKAPMQCGDCHGSPPPNHFAGACTGCHREANATGTDTKQGTAC